MLINYSTLTYYIYAFLVYTCVTDATFRTIRICPNMPRRSSHSSSELNASFEITLPIVGPRMAYIIMKHKSN